MKLIIAIIGSIPLFAVAAFCLFGFLATFEPTSHPGQFMAFRVGYSVVGLGCIAGLILLMFNALRRKDH